MSQKFKTVLIALLLFSSFCYADTPVTRSLRIGSPISGGTNLQGLFISPTGTLTSIPGITYNQFNNYVEHLQLETDLRMETTAGIYSSSEGSPAMTFHANGRVQFNGFITAGNFAPSGDFTNAIQIFDSNQTTLLEDFDTINNRIGIGTSTTPNTTLDVQGDFSVRRESTNSSTGAINNLATTGISTFNFTGASPTISGFANGSDGKLLFIRFTGSTLLTLKNNSGLSSSGNKILTQSGIDVQLVQNQNATLQYDSVNSLWKVLDQPFVNTSTTSVGNLGLLAYSDTKGYVVHDTTISETSAGSKILFGGTYVDFSLGQLDGGDGTGDLSVAWNARQLWSGGIMAEDWANNILYDTTTGGSRSIDWAHRVMAESDGDNSLDWANKLLINGGATSVDWDQRLLIDGSGNTKMDWGNMIFYTPTGTTHTMAFDNSGNTYIYGIVSNFKSVSTAGYGVPAIYAAGPRQVAVTSAKTLATYTVGSADGSFIVSANVLVTVSTAHSFTITCSYTDEGGTSRVVTMNVQQLGGTLVTSITNITGVGPYEGVPLHIRAKASTAITIATTGTFTTVTYNGEGCIQQIA